MNNDIEEQIEKEFDDFISRHHGFIGYANDILLYLEKNPMETDIKKVYDIIREQKAKKNDIKTTIK